MAATFGKANDFLSQEQLLRFRGLTNLLRATNGMDDLGTIRDNNNSADNGLYQSLNRADNVLYQRLAEFTNLLVRHREVVAVRSANKNSGLVQILEDPETNDNSAQPNDEGDADIEQSVTGKNMENKVAPLLVEIISTPPPEHMDSPGEWLLKHTIGAKKTPKTSITLEKHGSTLIRLITATHEASDDTYKAATDRLYTYVMLASVSKIYGRIFRGKAKHGRNLWDFLTKTSEDIYGAPGFKNDIPFEPSNAKGMKIRSSFLKFALRYIEISEIGLDDKLKPWLERPDNVEYTNDTRPIFQELLRSLLLAVESTVEDLLKIKQHYLMKKGTKELTEEENILDAADQLDAYAITSSRHLTLLSDLLGHMRPVVEAHLNYLKCVFAIQSVKITKRQPRELNTSSPPSSDRGPNLSSSDDGLEDRPKDGPEDGPEDRLEDRPEDRLEDRPEDRLEDRPEDRLEDRLEDRPEAFFEESQSILKKTFISKEEAYSADDEEIDSAGIQEQWDRVALKYLDLICLHQNAVLSLGKYSSKKTSKHSGKHSRKAHDIRTYDFLKHTRFEYVRCFQDQADSNMMSMDEVMKSLRFTWGKRMGSKTRAKVKAFIQNHDLTKKGEPVVSDKKWEDEKGFDGNFHCETLMLSLHLLHRARAIHGLSSDDDGDNLYLRLPPQDIIESFAKPAKVLPVSKCCCPACYALMKYVDDTIMVTTIYPRNHETWFTTALPPWLPRNAGMAVIEAAETKLVDRIEEYLRSVSPRPVHSTVIDHIANLTSEDIMME